MGKKTSSFIVPFWKEIFGYLRWFSAFQIVRHFCPQRTLNHRFVDSWVLLHSLLSILAIFVIRYNVQRCVVWMLAIWGALRVIEIVVYQINLLLFDPYEREQTSGDYAIGGYRRTIILAIHNYFEIIFWFTAFYLEAKSQFIDESDVLDSWLGSLYYSVVTVTTLGYGDVTPNSSLTQLLVVSQTAIGLLIIVLIIGHSLSFLSAPPTLDGKEQNRDSR